MLLDADEDETPLVESTTHGLNVIAEVRVALNRDGAVPVDAFA